MALGRWKTNVTRYGQKFKERVVARLLPPESAPIETVSRKVGISVATLERWRSEALANPGDGSGGAQNWTAAARLEAVITTALMDEASRNAWCRERGVYPTELEAGRAERPRRAA
jgi:transposase